MPVALAAYMMIGVAVTLGLLTAATIIDRVLLSDRFQNGRNIHSIATSLDGLAGLVLMPIGALERYRQRTTSGVGH